MRSSFRIAALALFACACAGPALAADAPDWLTRAAATPWRPPANQGPEAVVLLDDAVTTVQADGRIVVRRTYAARALTADAARALMLREVYTTNGSDLRLIRGWRVLDGRVAEIEKRNIVDVALADNDVYNEVRARIIRAGDALPGTVFGAETEVAFRVPYPQMDWLLQGQWPVLRARRTLNLPAGWDARAVTFNHADITPSRSASSMTWEVADLPALADEIAVPPMTGRAARLAVTFGPASVTALDDWASVSRWLFDLTDGQAAASPALAAKAKELTANAATDLDKIRAIGRYVQRVQYISIQTGLQRGGGYKPHSAADVLAKNYGDCKDKANLMRALLQSVGIHGNLVAIYSGDPEYVRGEWASPEQFNHCIVAIQVGVDTGGAAVLTDNTLGRVLFFDPTDEETPVGELPLHEQNSFALVMTKAGAPLVRVPASRAETQSVTRRVDATLSANGALVATIQQTSVGSPASEERYFFKSLTKADYIRDLERATSRQVPGAHLTLGTVEDDDQRNVFRLTVTLEAAAYGQRAGDALMLFRAPATMRGDLPALPAAQRDSPVRLHPVERRDRVAVRIPAGMTVDELPAPVALDTPYGRVTVTWQADGDRLTRDLSLSVAGKTFPAAEYPAVRAFVNAARDAERATVVLKAR